MVAEPVPRLVSTPDGVQISVSASGRGRALVAVHGTPSTHETWDEVRPLLEPHLRLYAVDRRGRGASGDGPVYSLHREYDDGALRRRTARLSRRGVALGRGGAPAGEWPGSGPSEPGIKLGQS